MKTQRAQIKQQLSEAKTRAEIARSEGLVWEIAEPIHIDVTVLAWIEKKEAASRWIERCIRSIERCGILDKAKVSRAQVRRVLWAFWDGE